MTALKRAWLCIGLVSLLGLLLTPAKAQGWAIQGQAVDSTGRPLSFALVRVCPYTASGAPCSPLTSLWSDIPQTHSISNPYTTDQSGNFSFVVATGQSYLVQVYVGSSIIYSYLYTAGTSTATVVEVNSVPISPASPANFVDTATVTWAFTGGQIKATAIGVGCGPVSGDNTSTNCGYENRAGDTAPTPAYVSTFGAQNAAANQAINLIAIGNQSADEILGGVGTSDFIGIGNQALFGDSTHTFTGHDAIGIGQEALARGSTTGSYSLVDLIGIGDTAGIGASGLDAIFIGDSPGVNATGSQDVIGIGDDAAGNTPSGTDIVGVGNAAAANIGTGSNDVVAIGDGSGANLGAGVADIVGVGDGSVEHLGAASSDVVGVGDGAVGNEGGVVLTEVIGVGNGSASDQKANVSDVIGVGTDAATGNAANDVLAIGQFALGDGNNPGNSGTENIAEGDHALTANLSGAYNVAIGGYTGANGWVSNVSIGNSNTNGADNTWIGYGAGPNTTSQLSNTIALGYNAVNTASNQAVIGNSSTTDTELHGNTTINGNAGSPSQFNLFQVSVSPATVANAASIAAPATVSTPSVIVLPAAPCTGYLEAATDTSGVMPLTCGTGGAVASVSNSDGTLTISPTTGAVVASLALAHANTWTATQTFNAALGFDASGATQAKLPVGAGFASAANGELGYDTTNKNWHAWVNGADTLLIPLASGFVSGHCGQPTSSGGSWTIVDIGAACGSSGGGSSFSAITSGSNTTATMTVGTGGSLAPTGSGTITANAVNLAASGNGGVTGLLPNANLANPATTVNGQTCTLGSSCTLPGYVLISKQTPSGTGTVTFSSLGSYQDLIVTTRGACTASATFEQLQAQFNSDTGANYDFQELIANNTATTPTGGTASANFIHVGWIPCSTGPSNEGGVAEFTVMDYAGTTFQKAVQANSGVKTGAAVADFYTENISGWWRNTSAITSVTVFLSSGNFVSGSSVSLYGRN